MVKNRINSDSTNKIFQMKNGLTSQCLNIFTYSTVRSASIKSVKVGIVYRFAQIFLLFYIIGWELFHNKGYQKFDTVSSVVTTKVKGQGFLPMNETIHKFETNYSVNYFKNLFTLNEHVNYRILDTADYVIPPNEYNSIFVMTNFIRTEQTQGVCEEEIGKYKSSCEIDSDCPSQGLFINTWNGIPTGKCINSTFKPNTRVCEIRAWCPTEHGTDRIEDNIIRNVLNYTIFIKNDVEFKLFKKKHLKLKSKIKYKNRRNILRNITNSYISKCTYEDKYDPYCPVFQINYILSKAEPNDTEKYLMLLKGGVVVIEITWNCDFDIYARCLPKYSFKRFDLPFGETNTASGYNFRFATRFKMNGIEYRELYKAYGIRFIINVSGIGGKFNIVPLMLTIGAGFGLMSISVLIADCVMLHCTKERKFFQKMKELDIKENINLDDTTNVARL